MFGAKSETQARVVLVELLSFEIAEQEFCVDVDYVREIRGWTPASPVPQTADYVLGMITLRGIVMPVLDVRMRLGRGPTDPSSRHVIIVVENEGALTGLLVDSVRETFQLDPAQMQAPPAIVEASMGGRLVDAIIPLGTRMVSRLVVPALLPRQLPLIDQAAA